jgi:hypothetical protein
MEQLDKINFSYNWNNKLYCQAYTTLRRYNPNRYKIGDTYDIYLNDVYMHKAMLMDIKKMQFHQIDSFVAYIDTGKDIDEFKSILRSIYKNPQEYIFCLLLLKKIEL